MHIFMGVLAPHDRGSGSPVYSSDQVFAQAGNGVDFCFLELFLNDWLGSL